MKKLLLTALLAAAAASFGLGANLKVCNETCGLAMQKEREKCLQIQKCYELKDERECRSNCFTQASMVFNSCSCECMSKH